MPKLPKGWEEKELGEVCEINPSKKEIGSLPSSTEVTFVPMAAVSEKGFILEKKSVPLKDVLNGFPYFGENDVLLAKITPCLENGKRAIAKGLKNKIGFGSTEFHIIRAGETVSPEWIFYIISSSNFRKNAEQNMTGTAGQKRVPTSFLKKYKIVVPPLPIQRKIVAILKKAERIKQKRQQQIEASGKLAQSVFLEMFGDPRFNSKYPSKTLNEVCDKITDGTHKTPVYVEHGIPFLRVTDITNSNESKKFLTKEEHAQLTQRCRPEKGDVLYTKNGTVGIAKMVDWDYEFSIFVSLCLLKPRKGIISAKYLETFLNTPIALEQALHRSKKGTITNLHLNQIKMIKLPLPPMKLQGEFAGIIQKIEATRQKQQQAKMHEENLFDSLMQKAFDGELTG